MKATFLLSKDPSVESTGDMTMATLVIELAKQSYDTAIVCLSQADASAPVPIGLERLRKPPPKSLALLAGSLRRNRSLVHTRFILPELVDAVDRSETDVFVADHCFMAEAVLDSRRYAEARDPAALLAVSTVVPEALVWRATRGFIGKVEGPRIIRDELRVAKSAYTVGTYDREEADFFLGEGVTRAHWLDLSLPAKAKAKVAAGSAPRRLVFFGDRRWAPNQEAFLELLTLWPAIAKGIDGAELVIVGAPDPAAERPVLPDAVTDHGFVDDLDGLLASCRALVAPISTGGGVRVKILDSVSRGLPVVGTSQAVGSLSEALGMRTFDDRAELVEQCRTYLLDAAAAGRDGDALYELNDSRWTQGVPHASVEAWLKR